jgi:hypothetical protein
MELATATLNTLPAGEYTVIYKIGTGTAVLNMYDPSDADSTAQAIPSSSFSASTSFNIKLCNKAVVTPVLTGDAKCFILGM